MDFEEDGFSMGASLGMVASGGEANLFKVGVVARDWQGGVTGLVGMPLTTFDRYGSEPHELLSGYNRRNADAALREVRSSLIASGWTEIPRGRAWYNFRFMRPQPGDESTVARWAREQKIERAARKEAAGKMEHQAGLVVVVGLALALLLFTAGASSAAGVVGLITMVLGLFARLFISQTKSG